MNFSDEFENLVKANIPAIQVVTYEWQRLYGFCVAVADENNLELFTWSIISGLKKWDKNNSIFIEEKDDKDPLEIFEWYQESYRKNCILILEDFHPFIAKENLEIIRYIREICRIDASLKKTLIIQTPFNVNVVA